jgi:iron complex outermembrane receptor protein
MRHFKKTALSIAATQAVLLIAVPAFAQSTDGTKTQSLETVVVSGQRAALQSAQKKKQDADEIVDSIVAEDIGKLPDRSVTEVLQRIVGVSMDRTSARTDPAHYSVEGSGIIIRGLTYVGSQLNGREIYSANGGRGLSFEDVPPELMQSVNVYKNPSAEQIEGGIGGLVDLRTAMPFDYNGFKGSLSLSATYGELDRKTKPSISGLLANTWNTDLGKIGMLLDVAWSKSSTRSDTVVIDPYYLRTVQTGSDSVGNLYKPTGDNTWVPRGMSWREQLYDRERKGIYGALQWKKDSVESSLTYFRSQYDFAWNEFSVSANSDPYNTVVTNGVYDSAGRMTSGVLTNPSAGGHEAETGTRYTDRNSRTEELAWNLAFRPSTNWTLTSDLQLVKSRTASFDSSVATAVMLPKETIDTTGSRPTLVFDASDIAYLSNPSNYYWAMTMENFDKGKATQKAWKGDARYVFQDAGPLNDLRFGVRFAERDALTINSVPGYNWSTITHAWQKGWDVAQMATITNYNDPYFKNTFSNFLGGKASMPAMYFPAVSVAANFPTSYLSLRQHYHDLLCSAQTDPGWWQYVTGKDGKPVTQYCQLPWVTEQTKALATFSDDDPNGRNEQHERTTTAYSQLRFSFDDWKLPVDGNIGLRAIRTRMHAEGYTVLTVNSAPAGATGVAMPAFTSGSTAGVYNNSYVDVLPSLNLKLRAQDNLQFRFAYAKAVSRPGMDQLQAYSTLTLTPEVETSSTGSAVIKRRATRVAWNWPTSSTSTSCPGRWPGWACSSTGPMWTASRPVMTQSTRRIAAPAIRPIT